MAGANIMPVGKPIVANVNAPLGTVALFLELETHDKSPFGPSGHEILGALGTPPFGCGVGVGSRISGQGAKSICPSKPPPPPPLGDCLLARTLCVPLFWFDSLRLLSCSCICARFLSHGPCRKSEGYSWGGWGGENGKVVSWVTPHRAGAIWKLYFATSASARRKQAFTLRIGAVSPRCGPQQRTRSPRGRGEERDRETTRGGGGAKPPSAARQRGRRSRRPAAHWRPAERANGERVRWRLRRWRKGEGRFSPASRRLEASLTW